MMANPGKTSDDHSIRILKKTNKKNISFIKIREIPEVNCQ